GEREIESDPCVMVTTDGRDTVAKVDAQHRRRLASRPEGEVDRGPPDDLPRRPRGVVHRLAPGRGGRDSVGGQTRGSRWRSAAPCFNGAIRACGGSRFPARREASGREGSIEKEARWAQGSAVTESG